MAFALNFDKRLWQILTEKKAGGYRWEMGWCADKRSRVDVAGLKDKAPVVLIEVELKKDNPVENVVKIWNWATKEKVKGEILFVHAFSAHYLDTRASIAHPRKRKQYERAEFIGKQMAADPNLRIEYKILPIVTTTRNGKPKTFKPLMRRGVRVMEGGGAMLRAAERLAESISRLV